MILVKPLYLVYVLVTSGSRNDVYQPSCADHNLYTTTIMYYRHLDD